MDSISNTVDRHSDSAYVLLEADGEHHGGGGVQGVTATTTQTNRPMKNQLADYSHVATERCIACLKVVVVVLCFLYLSTLLVILAFGDDSFRLDLIFHRHGDRVEVTPEESSVATGPQEGLEMLVDGPPQPWRHAQSLDHPVFLDRDVLPNEEGTAGYYYLVHYHVPWSPASRSVRDLLNEFAATSPVAQAIQFAEIDCMENHHWCRQQAVFSFPALRIYRNGSLESSFEQDHVGIMALEDFVQQTLLQAENHHDKGNVDSNHDDFPQFHPSAFKNHGDRAILVFEPESCHRHCRELDDMWRLENKRANERNSPRVYRVQCKLEPKLCQDAGVSVLDDVPDLRWYYYYYEQATWVVPHYSQSEPWWPHEVQADAHTEFRREQELASDDAFRMEKGSMFEGGHPKEAQEYVPAKENDPKEIMNKVRFLKFDTFDEFVGTRDHVFVFFFAPWCVWSQRSMPIWNNLAQELATSLPSVEVVAVDCQEEADLCSVEENVLAYPTFRWYVKGDPEDDDYLMGRTVDALSAYAQQMMEAFADEPTLQRAAFTD